MSIARRILVSLSCVGLAAVLATAAEAKRGGSPRSEYDEGLLQQSYFSSTPLEFREYEDVDYLWVKDGFSIDGRTFHMQPWGDPEFLDDDADGSDRRLAREISKDMADVLADVLGDAWHGKAKTSTSSGDVKVIGRVVDCSTGNEAAKAWVGWGAGSGSTTVDIKFVDAKSGELLAAVHHRALSGTVWSSTSSELVEWVADFGEMVRAKGFTTMYAKGDTVDE